MRGRVARQVSPLVELAGGPFASAEAEGEGEAHSGADQEDACGVEDEGAVLRIETHARDAEDDGEHDDDPLDRLGGDVG